MSKLSVIVPCYNEEAAAGRFLQETGRVLEQMTMEEERKKRGYQSDESSENRSFRALYKKHTDRD